MITTTATSLPASANIWGTVVSTDGATVRVKGLSGLARLGDLVEVGEQRRPGEIVATGEDWVAVLLMAPAAGLATGERAWLMGPADVRPSDAWLGQVVDAFGRCDAVDPVPETLTNRHHVKPEDRRPLGARLRTGLSALDTFLPFCQGQRLGVFAGSGVGKSRLLSDLALGVEADVVVVGLIGERSREVGEFVRLLRSSGGIARAVIVTATSDESALAKRRAARLTLAAAEHFRDQGKQVLCLFDSVTRYAEAHREVALAAGEPPALRAFPPSTVQAIAQLCERAGPGARPEHGDITAVFTVLVAGSDMEEPVADMVRGILDGHVILDRAIAERGRFPAIDLRRSVSRSAPGAWIDAEEALANEGRRLLAAYEESAPMIQAGLYAQGADPTLDAAVAVFPALDAFIGNVSRDAEYQAFVHLAEILGAETPYPPAAEAAEPIAEEVFDP